MFKPEIFKVFNLLQATVCSLAGMEAYEEDTHSVELLLDNIIGKTFVAEIQMNTDNESQYPMLVLYDTSTDEDINVNQMLTDKIISYKCTPRLPQVCVLLINTFSILKLKIVAVHMIYFKFNFN